MHAAEWKTEAACQGVVTSTHDPFTPDLGPGRKLEPAVQDGLKYCADCPVIQQCAQEAIDQNGAAYGVWAGIVLTGYRDSEQIRRLQVIAAGDDGISPIPCRAPGCDRIDLYAKGYCHNHYRIHNAGFTPGAHSPEGLVQQRREWMELVATLQRQGLNEVEVATYLGVKPDSVRRRMERYRALERAESR